MFRRLKAALEIATAIMLGIGGLISATLAIPGFAQQVLGEAIPSWPFLILALPLVAAAYRLAKVSRRKRSDDRRVEVTLSPELFGRMETRRKERGLSKRGYLRALIQADTKGR